MARGGSKRKAPVTEIAKEIPVEVEVKEAPVVADAPATEEVIEVPAEVVEEATQVKELEVIAEPAPLYTVHVTHPSLRRRANPSLKAEVLGLITDRGEYPIFAEDAGWGKLADDSWIKLEFTEKI